MDDTPCQTDKMQVAVLSSGPLAPSALHALFPPEQVNDTRLSGVIYITNSSHDISVSGLRFAPDLDAAAAALAGGAPTAGTSRVHELLAAWGLAPHGAWPQLNDDAVAAAIARTYRYARGESAVEAASAQLAGVLDADASSTSMRRELLPVTEVPVEMHVVEHLDDGERSGRHVMRWVANAERGTPEGFVLAGLDQASASPGVLDAIRSSDVVVILPMSPVLDAAGLLAVPGVRDALRGTTAPVVVLSPVGLAGGYPETVDSASWQQAGLTVASSSLARLYADFTDRLVIDDGEPAATYPARLDVRRAPLAAALAGDVAAASALRDVVLSAPA